MLMLKVKIMLLSIKYNVMKESKEYVLKKN